MAAYRQVYDSRHLQTDCQNRNQLRNPTLGNRVWTIFFIQKRLFTDLERPSKSFARIPSIVQLCRS